MLTIHNEELARRKDFQSIFEGHFLNTLFPGMEDLPPAFATQAPPIFDSKLPRLCMGDVELLRKIVPELQEHLQVPDMSPIMKFFYNKSVANTNFNVINSFNIEEVLTQVVKEFGLHSNLDENMLNPIEGETYTNNQLLPQKEIDK